MSSLATTLGLGEREHAAVVGAGGKTTLVFGLGWELAGAGYRTAVTTTTKLGADQTEAARSLCTSAAPDVVAAAVEARGSPVAIVRTIDAHKATGPTPRELDRLWASGTLDYLFVEADGARRKRFKAPADHEPVIPETATLVVVVMGVDGLGGRIDEVCHRPERVAALSGVETCAPLTVDVCAAVISHDRGGLKGVVPGMRVVVALTGVQPETEPAVAEIERRLAHERRFERTVRLDPPVVPPPT